MAAAGARALGWVSAHDDRFAQADDEGADSMPFVKRTAELAVIAATLLDVGHPDGRILLEKCWGRLGNGATLEKLAPAVPAVATIYVAFWRHGLRSDVLERALVEAAPAAEEPAVRLLVTCALRVCGLPAPWDLEELLRDSWIGGLPPTWQVTIHDAYIATHVVLFLAPAGLLPELYCRYLRRAVPVWFALFARAGHVDLVGELIMTAHALGDCVAPTEWQYLFDAQEPDGLVPFRLAWRGREVPVHTRFQGNYHSTLVGLAACTMCQHE